jgi:regulatory protein
MNLSKEQALQKARQYCAYQERCHTEVKEKLFGFGLYTNEVNECMAALIEENYLNEERFALAFAGGKFRINHWGKIKIRYALKQKQVSDYCIKKALMSIDEKDYLETLGKLYHEKLLALKDETVPFVQKRKIMESLLRKGFEINLVNELSRD